MSENPRTETARANDDHEIIDEAEPTPAFGSTAGGRLAQEIGSRDEEQEVAGATGTTRVHGADKVQPFIATRADNEGANG